MNEEIGMKMKKTRPNEKTVISHARAMLTSPARVMQLSIQRKTNPVLSKTKNCAMFPLIRYYASLAGRKGTRDYILSNTSRANGMPVSVNQGNAQLTDEFLIERPQFSAC